MNWLHNTSVTSSPAIRIADHIGHGGRGGFQHGDVRAAGLPGPPSAHWLVLGVFRGWFTEG